MWSAPRDFAADAISIMRICPPPVMAMIVVRGHKRFNSMTTSIPSLFGMKMSVMTMSGGFLWHMAMPALPSEASSTLKPARVSIMMTVERTRGSSSITRIRGMASLRITKMSAGLHLPGSQGCRRRGRHFEGCGLRTAGLELGKRRQCEPFPEKVGDPQCLRLALYCWAIPPCKYHDSRQRVDVSDFPQDGDAVDVRHVDIQNRQIRAFLFKHRDGLLAPGCQHHLAPLLFEHGLDQRTDIVLIVDDENLIWHHRPAPFLVFQSIRPPSAPMRNRVRLSVGPVHLLPEEPGRPWSNRFQNPSRLV